MNTAPNIQLTFLDTVKKKLPPNLSFSDELAELLNISRDSAYRRIRGETVLSLDEVKKICENYNVSLDALLSPNGETVTFHHRVVNNSTFTLEHWLSSILENLKLISSFPTKEMFYAAKDMPIFHYFRLNDASAFKMFFWMKTVLRHPEYAHEKFDPNLVPKSITAVGSRVWDCYKNLSTTEIWSDEIINATIRQVEFYYDCDVFQSVAQAHAICDEYINLLRTIQDEAAAGRKSPVAAFTLYKNDILIADNTVFFKMGDKRVTFKNHNTLEFLSTSQESFCSQTEGYLENLTNKSTLISGTGEKDRSRFFSTLIERVQALKSRIR